MAKRGLFNSAADLGFFKDARPAPSDYVLNRLDGLAKNGEIEKEAETCRARLNEYHEGLAEFDAFSKTTKKGKKKLESWDLAETALEKTAGDEHPDAITDSGGNRFCGSASNNLFP